MQKAQKLILWLYVITIISALTMAQLVSNAGNSENSLTIHTNNVTDYHFDRVLNGSQTPEGSFGYPSAILDNGTHLLIGDGGHNRFNIYDKSGNYVGNLIGNGTADITNNRLNDPREIVTNGTNYFIADYKNHRVILTDLSGNYITQLGVTGVAGSDNAHFNSPHHVFLNGTHIFVSDIYNSRLQIFDKSLNYAGTISTGVGSEPRGIYVNATNVLVADYTTSTILAFDLAGNLIKSISVAGSRLAMLYHPTNIRFDPDTNLLYIVDYGNHRIQTMDSTGHFVSNIEPPLDNTHAFISPYDLSINATHLIVAEFGTARVQIMKKPQIGAVAGVPPTTVTETTTEVGQNQTNTETVNTTVTSIITSTYQSTGPAENSTDTTPVASLPLSGYVVLTGILFVPLLRVVYRKEE